MPSGGRGAEKKGGKKKKKEKKKKISYICAIRQQGHATRPWYNRYAEKYLKCVQKATSRAGHCRKTPQPPHQKVTNSALR